MEETREIQMPPTPLYEAGQRVYYHANWVRVEGSIDRVELRNNHVFYWVGTDLVPQEQVLPVDLPTPNPTPAP